MSFSMSNVKYKSHKQNLNQIIRQCYGLIKCNDILSKNVKYGLEKYINYRFTQRNNNGFNKDILQDMIIELLENTCHKNYISISLQDVINNEGQILYEIKMAIIYGATKHIYFGAGLKDLEEYNIDYKTNCKDVNLLSKDELDNEENIVKYFEDLII